MQTEVNLKSLVRKKDKVVYKKKLRSDEIRAAWFGRIFIWIMIAITLFPIVAVISASMAKGSAFTQTTFFPSEWTLENYRRVFEKTNFLLWLKNSLILCTAVALVQLVLSVPAAFAFSKLRFWGRKNGLMSLLILQMFPAAMALPAIMGIVFTYNLTNKPLVLILILAGGSAYNIWLLKGAVDGIPDELVEAAYIDGASTWKVFSVIILPLLRNMLIVIFLFAFIGAYSEFMFTSAILKNAEVQTIVTGLQKFIKDQFSANWTMYSSAAVMAASPIVIIFMLLQKYIASGLVSGSVKE
ncbi:maltose/maltodextrin ABC transporter permease [Clostridium sartagoforme AAU1]|jgi:arabinogalactan oligomer / maltooligosaccharide transport system permease protein|uniref:Maltose/maltodextrin ABC transporter permease n=1 Tax=Clostridium sartagoforme AAU1 TaxID=1202534 RepID=R9CE10_9CLOT|nr:ABC transporter permease subunit [Clostridium sartagoforme]EOR27537.1 maltose/maltodextrin ABC transporter permease [Clostridium sartagoforme AAU1]